MQHTDEDQPRLYQAPKISLWREDAALVLFILIAVLAAPLVALLLQKAAP
jgi:hypothetical protein